MNSTDSAASEPSTLFGRDIAGLPRAQTTPIAELGDGQMFDLVAAPVHKQLGDFDVRLLAYNGSVPGPTLRVRQGSTLRVNFTNRADHENTIHWHGLRVENRFDGTHETQVPVPVGETFAYQIQFPDPGVYWYHPHVREDYGQEMGLYGNILVVPTDPDYWPPVHREIALTVDDILLEDGKVAPFSRSETTYSAMGRFGNAFLINGAPDYALAARHGEVIRFYVTNTANTRVFRLSVDGARMKLIGGDSGRCEHEAFVETVVLAPSERAVIDVLFGEPGMVTLVHRLPDRAAVLGEISISHERAEPSLTEQFGVLRTNAELTAERQRIAPLLVAAPDKTLAFVAEMDLAETASIEEPVQYTCPMHPEIVRNEPGRCPICGMNLVPVAVPVATTYSCPMHPEIVSDHPGSCPICGMKLLPTALIGQSSHGADHGTVMDHLTAPNQTQDAHHGHHDMTAHDKHTQPRPSDELPNHSYPAKTDQSHAGHGQTANDGIEWEDDMVAINRMTTPATMRWKLVDRSTGAENHAIDWRFRVGDRVKIRLINEMNSDHPMHHPFHIHGAGRFLVLNRDGRAESNLMWKDTVLVRRGETVDILLDVTNPGIWMAHCHIAEHHESGMMMSFHVTA